jgi:hypothetical protein
MYHAWYSTRSINKSEDQRLRYNYFEFAISLLQGNLQEAFCTRIQSRTSRQQQRLQCTAKMFYHPLCYCLHEQLHRLLDLLYRLVSLVFY